MQFSHKTSEFSLQLLFTYILLCKRLSSHYLSTQQKIVQSGKREVRNDEEKRNAVKISVLVNAYGE